MTGPQLFADWIERQKAAPGLRRFSMTALAKKLEVSRFAVYSWLDGKRVPYPSNASAIARITNNAVPASAWRAEEA